MRDLQGTCRIAVVQSEPVLFDREEGTRRVVERIDRIAREHPSDLIVFPELLIPGYPHGMNFGFVLGARKPEGRGDYLMYAQNSVVVGGPETTAIGKAAARANAWVSVGISERHPTNGTLYNTNLVFAPDGSIDALHRKLKPTGAERVVWGDADRGYFPVVDTPWGPMGNLICWESYMPLARVALYQKGITIYISPNTNDNPEWQDTIKHIAIEGHCFFINADMVFTKEMYPKDLHCPQEIEKLGDIPCRGGSCVVDPFGHYVTQPVWDKEEIIYADLDMQQAIASRMEFDGVGHYARPDVLELRVHE